MKSNSHFLQSILDSQPGLMVFILDKKYRYTYFSKTHQKEMKSFWGATIAVGDNMLEKITSASVRKSTKNSLDRALLGRSFVRVKSCLDKNKLNYTEKNYAPTKNTRGNIIGVTVFAV